MSKHVREKCRIRKERGITSNYEKLFVIGPFTIAAQKINPRMTSRDKASNETFPTRI